MTKAPVFLDLEQIEFIHGICNKGFKPVIAEWPLTIMVNGDPLVTLLCTPNAIDALAVGFLFNEEIISDIKEITSISICPQQDSVDIWLRHQVNKPATWTKTSGCSGGVTASEHLGVMSNTTPIIPVITPVSIIHLLIEFSNLNTLHSQMGGVHTSALSDGNSIILVTEDIGRHNTIDKITGLYLLKDINISTKIIITTGRISSEMVQKAGRIKAQMIISRTSPTTRSIAMAEILGISLIGYARRDHFITYTHLEQILFANNKKDQRQESYDQ